jgi:hypothetical protein
LADAEVNGGSVKTSDWFAVAAAILVGSLLALQGWRNRVPSLDLIPHIEGAEALVHDGVIPNKGCLSSFGAYIPPGPTWLYAPGIAAQLPARWIHFPGSMTLFVLTAIGLYLLGKGIFGASVGVWTVAVYCVSERGLFFASSLWPRGHPAFVVWTVLFLCWWASQRRTVWLGAAAATFAIGMYVFMEILPLAIAVGFIWLKYRPPIRVWPIACATLIAGVVWAPYLHFESQREWRDLRAILSRKSLPLNDVRPYLCDAESTIVDAKGRVLWPTAETETREASPPPNEIRNRLRHAGQGLVENFDSLPDSPIPRLFSSIPWLFLIAVGIAARSMWKRDGQERDSSQGVLWRMLLIPWLLLLLIPETDSALSGRRFWWLWPLQVVAAVGVLHRLTGGRRISVVFSSLLVALAFFAGDGWLRVQDWKANGFSGKDAEAWVMGQRIDAELPGDARATGVGYSVEVWGHAFRFRVIDPRYKIGWEWDWLLRYDFGISNRIDCPEGVSGEAVFEVVQKGLSARFAPRLKDGKALIDGEKYMLNLRRSSD